jgi:hypothetical protein
MITGYDNKLTCKEKIEQCETCLNARWEGADWSVGIPAGVDDCRAMDKLGKSVSAERYYKNMYNGDLYGDYFPEHLCPFYAKQYPTEWQRFRCDNCNNPSFDWIRDIEEEDGWSGKMETTHVVFKCKHCGQDKTVDVIDACTCDWQ